MITQVSSNVGKGAGTTPIVISLLRQCTCLCCGKLQDEETCEKLNRNISMLRTGACCSITSLSVSSWLIHSCLKAAAPVNSEHQINNDKGRSCSRTLTFLCYKSLERSCSLLRSAEQLIRHAKNVSKNWSRLTPPADKLRRSHMRLV